VKRSPEELAELEARYQHALPPSFYPEAEQSKHLVWYGTTHKWPSHLEKMFVLCQKCNIDGKVDAHFRSPDFELHLLKHSLAPDQYVERFGEYLGATSFPVWYQP